MKSKAKKRVSGREKQRRHEQGRAQWEKDNSAVAFGLKQLLHIPRAPIGRGL